MRLFRKLALALVLIVTGSSAMAQGNDVFVPIAKYIRQGDADKLSAWFADNLEISVGGLTTSSSRNQAREIVRSFFEENRPTSFEITHTAGKPNRKYALGVLKAGGETYSVTIFVGCRHHSMVTHTSSAGDTDDTFRIQQLKIERVL